MSNATNPITLEKIIEEDKADETDDIGDLIYNGNRFSAARQFAGDIVICNQEYLKNLDEKPPFILNFIGPYLCYLTSINSFFYALLNLRHSQQDNGYTFSKKSENRLHIVG